ncbi:hypothetical protein AB1N83_004776 [Pleurotus pulmonarius]
MVCLCFFPPYHSGCRSSRPPCSAYGWVKLVYASSRPRGLLPYLLRGLINYCNATGPAADIKVAPRRVSQDKAAVINEARGEAYVHALLRATTQRA